MTFRLVTSEEREEKIRDAHECIKVASECPEVASELVRDIFKLLFIILARNIDCKSTLQKTLKQFGLAASKYERKSRYKSNFQCVSLRRRVCLCPVMSRDMFLQSAFQFGFLPSKPSFYPEI